MHMSIGFIAFLGHLTLSLCQYRTEQNRWTIKDFGIGRFPVSDKDANGHPKLRVAFTLTRTYNEPCYTRNLIKAWEEGYYFCGWLPVGQALKCSNHKEGASELDLEKTDFHTCDSYTQAFEGEEPVPENAKRWLRWRFYDLVEGPLLPPSGESQQRVAPFESVKMEIINGVASSPKAMNGVTQIRTYQAQFSLTKKHVTCEYADADGGYSCYPTAWQVNQDPAAPKVSCLPMAVVNNKCSVAVDVVEKNMTLDEFRTTYQSNMVAGNPKLF